MLLLFFCHCKISPYKQNPTIKKKQSEIKRKKTPEDLNRKAKHVQRDDEKTF